MEHFQHTLMFTYLGQSGFRNSRNQSSWDVMWLDAPESTNHTSSEDEVLVGCCADIEWACASLRTFRHDIYSRNSWHNLWVVDWSKPTLVASFGTPLRSGRVFHSTRIRSGNLVTWSNKMASPSIKLPLCVTGLLPMMRVVFSAQLIMSTSFESTCISSVESSSLIQLRVENLAILCISPWLDMVLLDLQYQLQVEKSRRILPCKDGRSDHAKLWC